MGLFMQRRNGAAVKNRDQDQHEKIQSRQQHAKTEPDRHGKYRLWRCFQLPDRFQTPEQAAKGGNFSMGHRGIAGSELANSQGKNVRQAGRIELDGQ
jgi:hypothetical protein